MVGFYIFNIFEDDPLESFGVVLNMRFRINFGHFSF